ncbi:hypothetical protein [Solirubrum puertoriconensis]|uniref:Uncharacterized protein n=1 Tax=Solirubrum puertoriconensis TaxID=1751427 RepID=A0A9X0HM76_SOLP1|nr:hypothetical protein [Solirubrum puertoriconensis]KUG08532.1 hypothetical protein ASU33_10260 [Solirubrum puertoriconensis]
MFRQFYQLRYYIVVALLAFAGFVWAGLRGNRLLGDDNESTENINGYRSGGSGGSGTRTGRFYHK